MKKGTARPRRGISIIVIILGILLVFAIIAGTVAWLNSRKKFTAVDDSAAANSETLMLDSRSAGVKLAAQKANDQAASGDVDGAAKTLTAAVSSGGNTDEKVSLYLQLALVYANAGRRDQALSAEASAMALSPDDWRIYKHRGSVYEQLGDNANARTDYQRADDLLKATPDYATYHNELAGLIANVGATQ